MKSLFTTKRLCRAGVIAALYVAFTYAFAPIAFGPMQVRPAEALTLLPLFFPEAVPALYVGCMLANLASPYLVYDVFVGSLATLLGALGTFLVGFLFRRDLRLRADAARIALGGLFPVLANAFVIPLVIVYLCDGAGDSASVAYWSAFVSILLTEAIWIYALGSGLYFAVKRLRAGDNRLFT